MGDFSDAILMGDIDQPKKKKQSFADAVLAPEIQREYTPTDRTSTITGQPELEWSPTGQESTSFGASVKVGFVDDPQTKIRILAESRGISPDRYRMIDGELVFQGDDGKWYAEEHKYGTGKLKAAAGNIVAHSPSIVLGSAGASAGPGMAALGAAGGEGIRKAVGSLVFDEPQTTMGNVQDMAIEGGLGYVTGGAGKGMASGVRRIGKALGGRTAKQAGRGATSIDVQAAKDIIQTGKDVGIDLTVPQATGSKRLADKFNYLGDSDVTSDLIQSVRGSQKEQISKSIYDFLDEISSVKSKLESGKRLQSASQKALERPIAIRKAKAGPIYEKAFSEKTNVDIKPVISWIDGQLSTARGNVKTNLSKAKKILEGTGKQKTKRVYSDVSKMTTKEVRDYDTSLKALHDAKIAIDDEISKASKARTGNVKRNYVLIKNKLLKQMDDANKNYARARKIYSEYSGEVERQGKKTLVADIAKLENDQVVTASRKLFENVATSPETVAKARRLIVRQDPDAWNAALKTYLEDVFEKQKLSAGGVDITTNIGGMFFKRTWGDPRTRAIMKAAMTPRQYGYFKKLSSVLDRAGMILRKESATKSRQEMHREITGPTVAKYVETVTRPMRTKSRWFGDWALNYEFENNASKLAEAMVSTKGMRQLERMYSMGTKGEKLIPALTAFLGMIGGAELKRAHGK